MSVYFTSDLHFGHKNIHKFRHFVNNQLHNEQFICNAWQNKVTKRDDVYVLGDAAFTMEAIEVFKDLPGRKYLIRGNHDMCDAAAYLKVFAEVYGLFKYKEFWLSHAPIHPYELRDKVNLHGHVHYQTITRNVEDRGDWSTVTDTRYFNCCVESLMATFLNPLVELDQLRKHIAERSNNRL